MMDTTFEVDSLGVFLKTQRRATFIMSHNPEIIRREVPKAVWPEIKAALERFKELGESKTG